MQKRKTADGFAHQSAVSKIIKKKTIVIIVEELENVKYKGKQNELLRFFKK